MGSDDQITLGRQGADNPVECVALRVAVVIGQQIVAQKNQVKWALYWIVQQLVPLPMDDGFGQRPEGVLAAGRWFFKKMLFQH